MLVELFEGGLWIQRVQPLVQLACIGNHSFDLPFLLRGGYPRRVDQHAVMLAGLGEGSVDCGVVDVRGDDA
jgi:hypothetical protein